MAIYDLTKTPADSYDAHTHLNDDELYHDVAAYVGRAEEFRVMQMNVVGYNALGNLRALEIANQYDNIYAVLGFQPDDAKSFTPEAYDLLAQQLQNQKVVGVGESGLDYYWDGSTPEEQKAAFVKHIELAKQFNLPLIVHNRDAFDDVLAILTEAKQNGLQKIVMHSFSGTPKQAQAFIDLDAYLSFSGVVTFKKAEDVRQSALVTPKNRLLVETDAPYLAPIPRRGQQNEPAFVKYVIDHLAQTLELPAKELSDITRQNANELFLKHNETTN